MNPASAGDSQRRRIFAQTDLIESTERGADCEGARGGDPGTHRRRVLCRAVSTSLPGSTMPTAATTTSETPGRRCGSHFPGLRPNAVCERRQLRFPHHPSRALPRGAQPPCTSTMSSRSRAVKVDAMSSLLVVGTAARPAPGPPRRTPVPPYCSRGGIGASLGGIKPDPQLLRSASGAVCLAPSSSGVAPASALCTRSSRNSPATGTDRGADDRSGHRQTLGIRAR